MSDAITIRVEGDDADNVAAAVLAAGFRTYQSALMFRAKGEEAIAARLFQEARLLETLGNKITYERIK